MKKTVNAALTRRRFALAAALAAVAPGLLANPCRGPQPRPPGDFAYGPFGASSTADEVTRDTAETDDDVLDEVDAAREELHRIMWLLRTVKRAVLTGLAAAEQAAPELELVIDDSLELADVRRDAAEHVEG